mmetsp:Transcript_32189/g.52007  ORF Transcript_32189/g.52007 Transcript_32189/m.52007 type:complete len:180 (+) Transcript_32189:245-784(+)|eukprot:CAMPEP_0184646732 /NCGR_PEP_ID=MMETSP0308-20130426/3487_1 /TAXON_ID=38269 /ORGANISM="Gloeochaete witrockiana, Strain SAG 46.84" /LENGTH=179 /DNA_ID=CAMNT_0027077025 /DNA_START=169 /DNA_END=708 /DNA_ORIENTATION=+
MSDLEVLIWLKDSTSGQDLLFKRDAVTTETTKKQWHDSTVKILSGRTLDVKVELKNAFDVVQVEDVYFGDRAVLIERKEALGSGSILISGSCLLDAPPSRKGVREHIKVSITYTRKDGNSTSLHFYIQGKFYPLQSSSSAWGRKLSFIKQTLTSNGAPVGPTLYCEGEGGASFESPKFL